jgi:hypothetical protein
VAALLVSDREREYTVGLLRRHWLDGRLTEEEFEERVEEAWRARFAADLWRALRFLPAEAPPGAPAQPAKSRTAVASLVLGILAVSLLLMSFGILFLITLPLAVTAWSLGREARRSGGGGAAKAGEALGVAGTVLSLLPMAGCATMMYAL